ncbi:hypothetical protein CBR_g36941 [Chara braunii]|uniref:Amidohydrolase-related domain-containing protein n=1 Tax=Chara braunii TaxID=69332 RepID=A0A388JZG0_CHABU|nr:hypothetical protein CBR_g36941 [Chara braunii]|eukprot:GBG63172.1 hypothetical protein CBR_g36941 [Chara braunii]
MKTTAPPSNMEAKIGMVVLIVALQFVQLQAKCTELGVCQSADTGSCGFLSSASSSGINEEAVSSGSIAILGGTVVNADGQHAANVYIKDGIITAVGPDVVVSGIDPHTHLDMPFMGEVACDDFFSGQAAALAGGTTMHIDFALPINGDLIKGFHEWEKKAMKSCTDYGFHMAITTWNKEVARDMEVLAREHA